ncbi:hypothetical protein [Roseovarius sp. D22-M7]|uniref:hypothetical protein n=1 Tax=Roseovarius sp. D22-M7 TaxID=3127116 RepID=UPI0030102DA7
MQLTFRGWSRETKQHRHLLEPVQNKGKEFEVKKVATFTTKHGKFVSLQKASNLGLTGDFLVEVSLDRSEVKRYFEKLIEENPLEAVEILHNMLGKATVHALNERSSG